MKITKKQLVLLINEAFRSTQSGKVFGSDDISKQDFMQAFSKTEIENPNVLWDMLNSSDDDYLKQAFELIDVAFNHGGSPDAMAVFNTLIEENPFLYRKHQYYKATGEVSHEKITKEILISAGIDKKMLNQLTKKLEEYEFVDAERWQGMSQKGMDEWMAKKKFKLERLMDDIGGIRQMMELASALYEDSDPDKWNMIKSYVDARHHVLTKNGYSSPGYDYHLKEFLNWDEDYEGKKISRPDIAHDIATSSKKGGTLQSQRPGVLEKPDDSLTGAISLIGDYSVSRRFLSYYVIVDGLDFYKLDDDFEVEELFSIFGDVDPYGNYNLERNSEEDQANYKWTIAIHLAEQIVERFNEVLSTIIDDPNIDVIDISATEDEPFGDPMAIFKINEPATLKGTLFSPKKSIDKIVNILNVLSNDYGNFIDFDFNVYGVQKRGEKLLKKGSNLYFVNLLKSFHKKAMHYSHRNDVIKKIDEITQIDPAKFRTNIYGPWWGSYIDATDIPHGLANPYRIEKEGDITEAMLDDAVQLKDLDIDQAEALLVDAHQISPMLALELIRVVDSLEEGTGEYANGVPDWVSSYVNYLIFSEAGDQYVAQEFKASYEEEKFESIGNISL